jgi:hypothetical protein
MILSASSLVCAMAAAGSAAVNAKRKTNKRRILFIFLFSSP